jgi:membrane protein required for colicin V production
MNLLDMLILAVFLLLIVRGIYRGFWRETGSLVGVILGVWLAHLYHPQVAESLKAFLPASKILPLISFALILLSAVVTSNLIGRGLKRACEKVHLGWADKSLGAGMAALKGIVLIYLCIVLITFFFPSQTPAVARSKLASVIIDSYQSMLGLVSPNAYHRWKKKVIETKRELDDVLSEKTKERDR